MSGGTAAEETDPCGLREVTGDEGVHVMRGADVDNNPFGAVEEDVDVDEDDISDEEEVVEGKDGAEYASGDEGGSCRCKAGGVLPEEERDRSSRMGEEACSEASISPSPGCREEQGKMDAIDEDRGPVAGNCPARRPSLPKRHCNPAGHAASKRGWLTSTPLIGSQTSAGSEKMASSKRWSPKATTTSPALTKGRAASLHWTIDHR